ncbi:MAG: cysteine dioxygenase family protein [Candidatus Eremiobacteraeota bacterium]|nr:cysteine dioxygenase family protein [Candidatus Eremiobacteraeota bacterium]
MIDSARVALAETMDDAELRSVMERFANEFNEYRSRLPAIPYAYSRTRLLVTPRYEVVAMQWSPGATSPIHDHGRSRCWVLMLEGTLEVENYRRECEAATDPIGLRETGRIVLRPGDVDYRVGPHELHRVTNPATQSAFSLQLYAEPIARYTVVDAHTLASRVVDAVCDLDITAD